MTKCHVGSNPTFSTWEKSLSGRAKASYAFETHPVIFVAGKSIGADTWL